MNVSTVIVWTPIHLVLAQFPLCFIGHRYYLAPSGSPPALTPDLAGVEQLVTQCPCIVFKSVWLQQANGSVRRVALAKAARPRFAACPTSSLAQTRRPPTTAGCSVSNRLSLTIPTIEGQEMTEMDGAADADLAEDLAKSDERERRPLLKWPSRSQK